MAERKTRKTGGLQRNRSAAGRVAAMGSENGLWGRWRPCAPTQYVPGWAAFGPRVPICCAQDAGLDWSIEPTCLGPCADTGGGSARATRGICPKWTFDSSGALCHRWATNAGVLTIINTPTCGDEVWMTGELQGECLLGEQGACSHDQSHAVSVLREMRVRATTTAARRKWNGYGAGPCESEGRTVGGLILSGSCRPHSRELRLGQQRG